MPAVRSVRLFAGSGSLSSRQSESKTLCERRVAMKLPQTGGCQCGKIRYELTEAPQLVYTCHCTDCQRLTSSAFSLGIVVAEAGFRLSGIDVARRSGWEDSDNQDENPGVAAQA